MGSTTSSLLSKMKKRRAERKKPKRFVVLKKVSLDPSQHHSISNAQATLPKHPITEKHVGRSSTAFTVAMAFHILIGVFISLYVIVDQIKVEDPPFDVSMIEEKSKPPRPFMGREAPNFNKPIQEQERLLIKQPVRTDTSLPSNDGFRIPEGPDTGLDLTPLDVGEGPTVIEPPRNVVKPTSTIQPEIKPPGFQIQREAPELLDKLDTPAPDADDLLGGIDTTPKSPRIVEPTYKFRVKPKYPESAKKAKKEGDVLLAATITEKGIATDIVALTQLGFGLEDAAIAALKKSTFHPATKAGKPISRENVQIPYEFKLKAD